MIAWRVIKARYRTTPLATIGAYNEGGRWNSPGRHALYCSESLALATLELFVHTQSVHKHLSLLALKLEVPDEFGLTVWSEQQLPKGWQTLQGNPASRSQGDAWFDTAKYLALSVPSVVVPMERNIILNGAHAGFGRIRVVDEREHRFDDRMWGKSSS